MPVYTVRFGSCTTTVRGTGKVASGAPDWLFPEMIDSVAPFPTCAETTSTTADAISYPAVDASMRARPTFAAATGKLTARAPVGIVTTAGTVATPGFAVV